MTYSIDQIGMTAKYLIDNLREYSIWCFHGEMGSGKTTLIKEICEKMGVTDTMSSPSFGIVNEYRDASDQRIYHFDFYRVRNIREAIEIGAEEYFDSGNYCLIEWPERIIDLLPDRYAEIRITLVGDNQRQLNLIRHDGEH